MASDIRDPARTIPFGVIAALAVATTMYVAGTLLLVAALPADELRDDITPIATAAETFGIRLAVPLVVAAALAAFASTGNAGIMSASRYPLALARDGILWARFARVNEAGVPVAGVILSGATIAAVVTAFDVEGIAKLASAFVLISFAMMNASVIVLRQARVPGYRPSFRVPWSPWVPGFGVLTSVVLVIDLGPLAVGPALALVVGGTAWHRWVRRGEQDTSGALAALGRRRGRRLSSDDIAQLQEAGPRAEDAAPETLDRVVARRLGRGAGRRELRREVATPLAEAESISDNEASAWLAETRHAIVELDDGSEVHLIGLDAPADPVIALAWAPADGNPDHTDIHTGHRAPSTEHRAPSTEGRPWQWSQRSTSTGRRVSSRCSPSNSTPRSCATSGPSTNSTSAKYSPPMRVVAREPTNPHPAHRWSSSTKPAAVGRSV